MLLKTMLITIIIGGMLIIVGALLFLGPARIVVTDSMAPSLRAGDLVFLRPTGKVINPGTVVTYDFQGKLITHRVVEVVGDMLVTKDPAYGGSSELVEGVAEEDIREVLSEAG